MSGLAAYQEAKKRFLFSDEEWGTIRASEKAKLMVTDPRNKDDEYLVCVYGREVVNDKHPLLMVGDRVRLATYAGGYESKGVIVTDLVGKERFLPDTRVGALTFLRVSSEPVPGLQMQTKVPYGHPSRPLEGEVA